VDSRWALPQIASIVFIFLLLELRQVSRSFSSQKRRNNILSIIIIFIVVLFFITTRVVDNE